MSPRSSVQTQRPCMPARLSEKPIACALNPTAGRCGPVSRTVPVSSKIAARSSGPRRSVRRGPAAVHAPSNSCHPPAGGVCGVPPDWLHAAVSSRAMIIGHRRRGVSKCCDREIIFFFLRIGLRIPVGMLLLCKLPSCDPLSTRRLLGRLSRRHIVVLTRSLLAQLLERLGDGEPLILPPARPGKRRHATNCRDAITLGLEQHQVERFLAMPARATSDQQGSRDALEFTRRNVGARVALHALDRALDL